MCEPASEELRYSISEENDENTWEELDPEGARQGEREELERCRKVGVYEYVSRGEAKNHEDGGGMKVKWARFNNSTTDELDSPTVFGSRRYEGKKTGLQTY